MGQFRKKMDPELKAKWLKALRSGDYQQSKFTLRDARGHCCLGVLCDIVDPDAWRTDETHTTGWGNRHYNQVRGFPFLTDNQSVRLSYLNDKNDLSFEQIAVFIEEEL